MADLRRAGPAGLNLLSASEAAAQIAAKKITSEALVTDCLARIAARDPQLHAWAFVNRELALGQARARDKETPRGVLHGVPVGIKDVLDTGDMPTAYGSKLYAGHRPNADTACVALLRLAGAVILGKTATTEFATPVPIGVRNPHDLDRSPGVSSSGSAASVADFHVPVALGTQTGGSVIRPSTYCGLYGYKASLAGLDRGGIRQLRPTLDTLGFMVRSADDIALVRRALTHAQPAPPPARKPKLGVCRTPQWPMAKPEIAAALEQAEKRLAKSANLVPVELPAEFDGILDSFRVIANVEGAAALETEMRDHLGAMNRWLKETAAMMKTTTAADYEKAQAHAIRCRNALGAILRGLDGIITPAASSESPKNLTEIEDSSFNSLWTLMHGPCVTIPAFTGPAGMPVGLQLVGANGSDDATIALAKWITRELGALPLALAA
jgi:Asp-tRNA(Asn)/Glu-tRNA(Gln) amidotransferase A subunit family amidase